MVQGLFNIPVLISPAQPSGLASVEDEPNLASVLQSLNYSTYLLGKWHLGYGHEGSQGPTAKGFDGWYGIPMTHSEPCSDYTDMNDTVYFNFLMMRFRYKFAILGVIIIVLRLTIIGNRGLFFILTLLTFSMGTVRFFLHISLANPSSCILVRDTNLLEQPYRDKNLTLKMTDEALKYLHQVKYNSGTGTSKRENPFFLMVNDLTPHVPPIVSKYHQGKSGQGMYYDSVLEMDWSVGKIMSAVKELGLDDTNTLVYFSSDNGPTIYNGFTDDILDEQFRGTAGSVKNSKGGNIPLRGWKGTNFEGGIRVPGIIRWPGVIKGGRVTNALTSQMDLLPTIIDIMELDDWRTRLFDGKSLLNFLKFPSGSSTHHKFMFHYCDMTHIGAVTYLDYKLHFSEGWDNYSCRGLTYDKPHLYNLADDPGESSPLPLNEYDDVLTSIHAAMKQQEKSMSDGSYFSQLMFPPIPWYYPCDNFPTCTKSSMEVDDLSRMGLDE
jgi:arylsulfatase A-like enzyme